MTTMAQDSRPHCERVDDVARIQESLALAVQDALVQHKQAGKPVAVWRNGRVEWIPPEEIPDTLPEAT
jgi:hypothetical protein